ncbi:hypothetical protein [Sulfurimonas sp. C5]|uniref:hypothetical protein n=1 Tax=Sulfurimonas sp. C5 TaxID=3036947 RepID=UPI002455D82B|nr:hypothetical protein [Sulfurimonas sp. C5]MDH4945400.1 hypothetical protein [Sulfurimonas sp. C5]
MKMKSLVVILLVALFTISLEAQLFVDNSSEMVLVEQKVSEISDVSEETDDNDRLFFNFYKSVIDSHVLVKKIDFHNKLSKQEFLLKIHKPPKVL